jgi:hypothetical protein
MRQPMQYFSLGLLALFMGVGISIGTSQEQGSQQPTNAPSPTPNPDDEERIRIFTEEVVLPIVAYDSSGHFDPTITPDDVLVLEDGIAQQVKSARRIPLNVVLLIDMGSILPFTQHLDVTRQIVTRVLSKLRSGDRVLLIQFANRAEVLQDWTDETVNVLKALDPEHGKLLSSSRSRTSEGIRATVNKLAGKEPGSIHLVFITDGDDPPGSNYTADVNQLLRYQPTVHVLSYTTMVSQETRKRRGGLFFDRAMKRFYKEYDNEVKASQRRLTAFADSVGGRIFLPTSEEEAFRQGDELAGEIAATCVLTYTPKRAIEASDTTKPRHIEVFPRRAGLRVLALRTMVTAVPPLVRQN